MVDDGTTGLETLLGSDEDERGDDRDGRDDAPGPGPSEPDDPAQIGRFVVLRRLGQGGMGVVYAAYDNELDRKLAIKLVRGGGRSGASDTLRTRVRREAQAMARLSHPNVVQVYEVGDFGPQIYVAMEFVTGPTLGAWTRARWAEPGPSWRQILAIYIEAGRGLAAAHAAGIVHRDFKPDNAIVGADGRVRVLDFGIARGKPSESPSDVAPRDPAPPDPVARPSELDDTPRATDSGERPDPLAFEATAAGPSLDARSSLSRCGGDRSSGARSVSGGAPLHTPLTRTGAIVGTPAYMSPEQFESSPTDERSDQFSFAVALWEALHRQRPFAGDNTPALMLAVLEGRLTPPPADAAVPAWLQQILLRALARDPQDRWPSMEAMLAALSNDPAAQRRARLRLGAALGAITLVLLAAGWFANLQYQQARAAEVEEASAQRREALAQAQRDRALAEAEANALRARDTARVLAVQGLDGDPTIAAALLRDVASPAETRGWRGTAVDVLQRPISLAVLPAHEDRPTWVEFSADGRALASASLDGRAWLWPLDEHGTPAGPGIALEQDPAASVFVATFSPDSRWLATATRYGEARLWWLGDDPGRTPPIAIALRGFAEVIWSLQFSHDGRWVAAGGRDAEVALWPMPADAEGPRTLDPSRRLAVGSMIWSLQFSHDAQRLAAGDAKGKISLWRLTDDDQPAPQVFASHRDMIQELVFSPDDRLLASAGADGHVHLIDADGSDRDLYTHDSRVHRVRFSADGKALASASRDGTVALWRIGDDGQPIEPPRLLSDHTADVWTIAFAPDGRSLATGAQDGLVRIWPLAGGAPLLLHGHSADVFRVRFSADGRRLVSAADDGSVRIWDADFTGLAGDFVSPTSHHAALTIDEDRRLLLGGGRTGEVFAYPLPTPDQPTVGAAARARPTLHAGPVTGLATHPSGWLASCASDPVVRLWSLAALEAGPVYELPTPPGPVRSVQFDDGGRFVAAGLHLGGEILLWSLAELAAGRREPTVLAGHPGPDPIAAGVVSLRLSSTHIASTGNDGRVLLSPLPGTPGPARELLDVDARASMLAFSPDRRKLAAVNLARVVHVWTLDDAGAPIGEPFALPHDDTIHALSFDRGGRLLLTACADAQAYLWDLEHPETPLRFTGAAGEVRDARFILGDSHVAVLAGDDTLRIWSATDPREDPIVLATSHQPTFLAVADDGRSLVTGGHDPALRWLRLDADLGVDSLSRRLRQATRYCLDAEQRVRLIGEREATAAAEARACSR